MTTPLVSILIPTCNRPQYLLKAVNSVLCQTYDNVEIIITDNSASFETSQIINALHCDKVCYVKNKIDIGPVLNWRNALHLAKGKYCLLLPDDDFLLNPFYIEEVVDIAEKDKVNLVITNCIIGYPTKSLVACSNHTGLIKGIIFRKGFWERYSIPTISNLFNREVALSLNAFHSNQILYSDIELWLKMMAGENEIYCYQKPSVYYLFHNENIVTTMSCDSLIKNSSFIRPLFSNNANDSDIHTLICRYIIFVDSIYHIASFSFIKKVFLQNKLYKGYYSFFGTLLIAKIKCYIIKIPQKLRCFVIKYFRAAVYVLNKIVHIQSNKK